MIGPDLRPPSRTTRLVTYIALTFVVAWWSVLLVFTLIASPVLAEAGWPRPPLAAFVAPALAIVAGLGSMLWLKLEPRTSTPVLIAGALVTVSWIFTFTLYSMSLLMLLFAMMRVDPS